ncbi:MAG: ionic transporter y4hA, partial [Polynucleobacter sp. 24-46-87]
MHSLVSLLNQTWFAVFMGVALIGAVLSSVHHAEVIAHKTGEPYGTLVLSICVTIIEVSLII